MKYIPDLTWDLCAFKPTIEDSFGLQMNSTKTKESLHDYDAIIIPGGFGTRPLRFDETFIDWIKTAQTVKYKISVCTGSLILGAAGFLKDKKATTNFNEYETLAPYCKEVLSDRIVEDGNIITAGAVASSIDLGLYLCEKWAGIDARTTIKNKMAYKC